MVESSFSGMGDIIDTKSTSMNVQTYSAFQTARYHFRQLKTDPVSLFKRNDVKYSPVDKVLCRDMRTAASRYKAIKDKKIEAQKKRQIEYSYKPCDISAHKVRNQTVSAEKEAKNVE